MDDPEATSPPSASGTTASSPGSDDPAAPVARPRRPPLARIWFFVLPFLVICVVATVIAAFTEVNYVSLQPGSAIPTAPLIDMVEAPTYEDDGELLYLTVGVGQQPRALEAVYGWLHPHVDVFPQQVINGDQTEDESRRQNIELMDSAKLIASKVAFERLGYEVEVTGTGVIVLDVIPGLPVEGKLLPGDVIVAVDGEPALLDDDLRRLVEGNRPGEEITLSIERGEEREKLDVDVELAPRPQDPDVAFIGITIQTRDLDFDFPFEVEIDSGAVGGPSAGLAFTLGILERLTPGSLTGGKTVAVTGAINPDGSVGTVGGVAQKVVAAEQAGAEVFLVPADEYEDAMSAAGPDIRVERVETLDDALRVLDSIGGNALELGTPGRPGG